jgi:hypothetical protein
MRTPLPSNLERQVLVKNRHCCCICQKDGLGKEVWIHHIDGNNSHNVINNLAVLCVSPHASQADAGLIPGKVGSGKKLKPDEVREYKKIWERKIEEENKIKQNILPTQKRKQLEILYLFEINKIKNEIISFKGNEQINKIKIKVKFNFFDQLVIEDFISGINIRKMLSNAYADMAIQSIGCQPEVIKRLAKSIWGLFLHLIGPHRVKIYSKDLILFRKNIDTLETLGSFSAEFNDETITLKEVCSIIYDLGEIAHWYNLSQEKDSILNILKKIKKSANSYEKVGQDTSVEKVARVKIIEYTLTKLIKKYKDDEKGHNMD